MKERFTYEIGEMCQCDDVSGHVPHKHSYIVDHKNGGMLPLPAGSSIEQMLMIISFCMREDKVID